MMKWPFSRNDTVGGVLSENRGIGPGFDHLRLLLALLIFNAHAGAIVNSNQAENFLVVENTVAEAVVGWQTWREPIYSMLVPTFFALSGFLVTSSAFRLRNVSSFLAFRGLRIFPALSIEVALSALLLGPVFTTLPLADYFGDTAFFRYFGNILGFVSFHLPGVFLSNPVSGIVNSNLWTLPPEFYCYLLLSLGMGLTVAYNRLYFTVLFVVATLILIPYGYMHGFGMQRGNLPTPAIVYYFFCGCLLYHWRDFIPLKLSMIVVAIAATYVFFYLRYTIFVAPLFLTYLTIAVGMTRWPTIPLMKSGDYSYGIYLYGFPISQAIIAAVPSLQGHPYGFRMLAFAATLFFAVASWHWLEKPALRLKKRLVRSDQQLPVHQAVSSPAP